MATTQSRKPTDYKPDPANANVGSKRGSQALERSLQNYGAGRSILVDKDGYVIAGNKTLEHAAEVGIDKVIEVETDGKTLVAVRRTDLSLLDDPAARELAFADNRVGELDLTWDAARLAAERQLLEAHDIFRADEIDLLIAEAEAAAAVDIALDGFEDDTGEDDGPARGLTAERSQVVKLALYTDQVATVERAIKAAAAELDTTNRAEAVLHIFAAYLEAVGE